MGLHTGDAVQFRFDPGKCGIILAIAPGGLASVQTRNNNIVKIATLALKAVRPEHRERVLGAVFRQ